MMDQEVVEISSPMRYRLGFGTTIVECETAEDAVRLAALIEAENAASEAGAQPATRN
jgi:hypothetical protein